MRITKISVEDLFDYYCYDIELREHSPITIVHAPNGYGKSTVLKLIRSVLSNTITEIVDVPFKRYTLYLDDGKDINIQKRTENEDTREYTQEVTISINQDGKMLESVNFNFSYDSLMFLKEEGIQEYIRREEVRRRRHAMDSRNGDHEPYNLRKRFERLNYALEDIRKTVQVNYIDSNRLYAQDDAQNEDRLEYIREINRRHITESRMRGIEYGSFNGVNENILRASHAILQNIRDVRQKYSEESEKRDRTFPNRLIQAVNNQKQRVYSDDEIKKNLEEIEKKRSNLEKTGLIPQSKQIVQTITSIDSTMRKFYTLYIDDTFKNLSTFDTIQEQLELFMDIINNRTSFSNKEMRIDIRRGVVFKRIQSKSGNHKLIPLEKLSSGEKHDFILFYELIFKSNENTVFLIDEPEISLHVAWQMQFVDMLDTICRITGTQALIATHSPDIVNGHDDLLVSLGDM